MRVKLIITSVFILMLPIIIWQYVAQVTPSSASMEETTVAGIELKHLEEAELKTKLGQLIEQWRKEAKISITYLDAEWSIDPQYFQFDIDKTIAEITDGVNNEVAVSFDKRTFEIHMKEVFPNLPLTTEEKQNILTDVKKTASQLQLSDQIQIADYLSTQPVEERIAQAVITTEGRMNGYERSIEIGKQSQFSVLDSFNEEEALHIIATGIYQLVLQTNFLIEERYIQNERPSFTDAGFEAYVNRDSDFDFTFYNLNGYPYTIKLEEKEGKLYFSLFGPAFLYDYHAIVVKEEEVEPLTKVYFQDRGGFIEKGVAGVRVIIERQVRKGMFIETIDTIKDYYPPVPTIEWRSYGKEDSKLQFNEGSEPRDDLWGIEGEKIEK